MRGKKNHVVAGMSQTLPAADATHGQDIAQNGPIQPGKALRVLHVLPVRWFNATAWYGLWLARLMREAGHDARAVTLPHTPPDDVARQWGVPTVHIQATAKNPLAYPGMVHAMHRVLEDFRPHVVDCHRGEGFVLWGLLKLLRRDFALVRTRGDQRPPKSDPVNRWLHNSVADAVVVTNAAMGQTFRHTLHTPEGRLWQIPGGVDTATFRFSSAGRQRVREEFGFSTHHCVIGLVGRFDDVKGQHELIRAVARLRTEHGLDHVRLCLLGFSSATSEDAIRATIAQEGMKDACVITGRRDDVPDCMSALDVGVVASKWSETIIRAGLELMACHRPLVATRVGVLPDLLDDEALCEPGDVDSLTALLARAVSDPLFVERLAARQQQVVRRLRPQDFLRQTLTVFEQARSM